MKLTIVTVCFNAEKVIGNTIESVLKQSKPIYEYVFIDGCSKDNTVSVIEKYRESFEKIGVKYVVKSEPDKGISDAFNKGVGIATGDLIGIINADDELMPNAHEVLCNVYNENVGVYYGNCWWIDKERNMEYKKKPQKSLDKLLYDMVLVHPSTFVKKSVYLKCGNFNEKYKYGMDADLLYRIYKAGVRFKYVDEELTKFKAGGVSDVNARAVYREGALRALSYGEPYVKVKVIEWKKIIRNKVVMMLKSTFIYKRIKHAKSIKQ